MLHNARAPALSNLFPQFRVVHQAGQGPHKRIEVRRRHKQSVYTVADELRTPGEAGRYTGKFHGHGLHQYYGRALSKAGKAKHVGRRIKLADTILIDRAFKYDLCASFCRVARTALIGFIARVVLRQPGCGKPHRTFTITVSGGLNVFWRRTFRFG